MKLLKRLREPSLPETSVAHLPEMQEEEMFRSSFQHDPYFLGDDEEEHIGVGAVMPQDVEGLNFLDGFRRRIHELHGEFPMNGVAVDYPEIGLDA